MSDCNRCLWATRNGSCASWDCRFVDQREAYEAYNREKADANKWIPCSERLPEEHVDVLCCFTSHGKTRIRVSHRMDYNYWNEVGRTGDMVAWQPLPEPWKGEEQ